MLYTVSGKIILQISEIGLILNQIFSPRIRRHACLDSRFGDLLIPTECDVIVECSVPLIMFPSLCVDTCCKFFGIVYNQLDM
jgi:hypothetical protein